MPDKSDLDVRQYVYNGTLEFLTSREYRSRTGYRGPKVFTKLGTLSPHSVNYEMFKISARPVTSSSGPIASVTNFHTVGWHAARQGVSVVSLRDEASTKMWADLANTNALLPLILKERQKTIDMVAQYVIGLARYRRNFLKELRKTYKGNDNKIVHNKWLEARYGWTPFLMECHTLINKELGLPSARLSTAKSAFFSDENKVGTETRKCSGSLLVRISTYAVAKDPFMKTASQYGIANPSLFIWEAVPYSFVVDWFLDVGGYLEHLGALSGIDLIGPSWSYQWTFHHETYRPKPIGANYSDGYASKKGKSGERTLGMPAYPNPLVAQNGLNLHRFFDAIALLRNAFGK